MNEIEKFWTMICADNLEIQEKGFDRWHEFDQNNPRYFENMQTRFSKTFYETYSSKVLHDFQILNMETVCNALPAQKTEIKLLLYDFHEEYGEDLYFYLIYQNVQAYVFCSPSKEIAASFWYKDIFDVATGNMLKHRIALTDNAYIEITFKNIRMVRAKKREIFV